MKEIPIAFSYILLFLKSRLPFQDESDRHNHDFTFIFQGQVHDSAGVPGTWPS
jgi:hypothetical protein